MVKRKERGNNSSELPTVTKFGLLQYPTQTYTHKPEKEPGKIKRPNRPRKVREMKWAV